MQITQASNCLCTHNPLAKPCKLVHAFTGMCAYLVLKSFSKSHGMAVLLRIAMNFWARVALLL